MGGMGSGGWNHAGRATVEETATLPMSRLASAGGLQPGARTCWRWTRAGRPFASIGVHAGHNVVHLYYIVIAEDGEEILVQVPVTLHWRPCRFGGRRAFFQCPQCTRLVLHLHLARARFQCRACSRLTYASRRERWRDRCLRSANKLRRRLGGEAGMWAVVAARPRHMHWRSYARIVDEIERRKCLATTDLPSR